MLWELLSKTKHRDQVLKNSSISRNGEREDRGISTKKEGGRTKGTLEIVGSESKTDALNLCTIDTKQLYFIFSHFIVLLKT